jgi:hypothetical protein
VPWQTSRLSQAASHGRSLSSTSNWVTEIRPDVAGNKISRVMPLPQRRGQRALKQWLFRIGKRQRSARRRFAHDAARALRLGYGSGVAKETRRNRRILCDDGMIYRYQNDGGLEGGEGAVTTCTFWYVECLARAGRLDARLAMGQGRSRANHLGLFSEELDKRGRQLGNFPRPLTHLAFISSARIFLTVAWISRVAANGSHKKLPWVRSQCTAE